MRIERSNNGAYRLPLMFNWAVGFSTGNPSWFSLDTYNGRGWSLRVLWFHVGRMDRRHWTHMEVNE